MDELLLKKQKLQSEFKRSEKIFESRFSQVSFSRKRYYGLSQAFDKRRNYSRNGLPTMHRKEFKTRRNRNIHITRNDSAAKKRSQNSDVNLDIDISDRKRDSKNRENRIGNSSEDFRRRNFRDQREGSGFEVSERSSQNRDGSRFRGRQRRTVEIKRFSDGKDSEGRKKREKSKTPERPQNFHKMSEEDKNRSQRLFSFMCNHIKRAKKDLKEESKSEKMKIREELNKKVNEAINKDHFVFKRERQRKMRNKAEALLRRKRYKFEIADWAIKETAAKNLEKKLKTDSVTKQNFLLTDTKPQIFFRPGKFNEEIEKRHTLSKDHQKYLLEKDLEKIQLSVPPRPDKSEFQSDISQDSNDENSENHTNPENKTKQNKPKEKNEDFERKFQEWRGKYKKEDKTEKTQEEEFEGGIKIGKRGLKTGVLSKKMLFGKVKENEVKIDDALEADPDPEIPKNSENKKNSSNISKISPKINQKSLKIDQIFSKNDLKSSKSDQNSLKNNQNSLKNDQNTVKNVQSTVKKDQNSSKIDKNSFINDKNIVKKNQNLGGNQKNMAKNDQNFHNNTKRPQNSNKNIKIDQDLVKNDKNTQNSDNNDNNANMEEKEEQNKKEKQDEKDTRSVFQETVFEKSVQEIGIDECDGVDQ